ncbi:MAG: response regulator [Thermoproteota archaeon]|nr:response regulator [Thermoproteota archaeon]
MRHGSRMKIIMMLETVNKLYSEKEGDTTGDNNPWQNKKRPLTDITTNASRHHDDNYSDNNNNNKDNPLARVIVVDDDPDLAKVFRATLLMNGFLVDAFTNPEEALQSLQSNSKDYYSLVLSDIRMPKISGIQLARKVKDINPSIKVVLMTAYEVKDNTKFSKEVFPSIPVDGFIQKPISITELTNKIFGILSQSKLRQG